MTVMGSTFGVLVLVILAAWAVLYFRERQQMHRLCGLKQPSIMGVHVEP